MSIQQTKFKEIADAIRAKTGSTDLIKPSEFASKVDEVYNKDRKPEQEKTVTPTENEQVILPDAGYTLSKVTVEGVVSVKDFLTLRGCARLFYQCSTLTDEQLFKMLHYDDTSDVTVMDNMFNACTSLTKIPEINTSKATTIHAIFAFCSKLKEVPKIDTSNATNVSYAFDGCTVLTAIPELDTNKATTMSMMFYKCPALKTVPKLNMIKVTAATDMFTDCSELTDITLKNIKINLQIGSGSSWGHLLTLDSLLGVIGELIDTGSTKTLTVGTANLSKLANVYVMTITITDEMRAADEFIDSKLPFEVVQDLINTSECFSTYNENEYMVASPNAIATTEYGNHYTYVKLKDGYSDSDLPNGFSIAAGSSSDDILGGSNITLLFSKSDSGVVSYNTDESSGDTYIGVGNAYDGMGGNASQYLEYLNTYFDVYTSNGTKISEYVTHKHWKLA